MAADPEDVGNSVFQEMLDDQIGTLHAGHTRPPEPFRHRDARCA
jgi:hypothetical protein